MTINMHVINPALVLLAVRQIVQHLLDLSHLAPPVLAVRAAAFYFPVLQARRSVSAAGADPLTAAPDWG